MHVIVRFGALTIRVEGLSVFPKRLWRLDLSLSASTLSEAILRAGCQVR
jgi:hypothetical protein